MGCLGISIIHIFDMTLNSFDIKIYHQNLEILRKFTNLGKLAFSRKILGVKNAYRQVNSVGSQVLLGVKKHFIGVDKEWLLTDHSNEPVNVKFFPKSYEIIADDKGRPAPDSDRGSYGVPDVDGFKVKKILESMTADELILIEALREIDPISRIGVYSSAITELNLARREKEVRKDKRKKEILDKAIKVLSKAIGEG